MAPLSKNAFAIMAMCEKTEKLFGITVDPHDGNNVFHWAFKMSRAQAQREGYGENSATGAISFHPDYNGCPYCGTKRVCICGNCHKVSCYHGQDYTTCPFCGFNSEVTDTPAEGVELRGGGL